MSTPRRRGFRTCPRGLEVQSLLFDRNLWRPSEALDWARRHGFRAHKTDTTTNRIRVRVQAPGGFQGFRTIEFGDDNGIQAVVGCPLPRRKRHDR